MKHLILIATDDPEWLSRTGFHGAHSADYLDDEALERFYTDPEYAHAIAGVLVMAVRRDLKNTN